MVADFFNWVSKEDSKNRKIVKILETSIKSLVPEHTVFEAFQKLKSYFVFPSFTINDWLTDMHGSKFLDFEIKKKYPFSDDDFFVQRFRLYDDGKILSEGMVSRFETKDGDFKVVILQR